MRENFLVERENPKMQKNVQYFGVLVIAVYIALIAVFLSGCTHEDAVVSDLPGNGQPISNVIADIYPAENADTVVVNPVVSVTLKSAQDTSVLTSVTLSLQEGSDPVSGTVSYSGATIEFTPSSDLKPETKYTATIKTSSGHNNSEGGNEHSWSFTTGKEKNKNAKLAVVSVTPTDNATDVATDVHPAITFNKELTAAIKNSVTINLEQGSTAV